MIHMSYRSSKCAFDNAFREAIQRGITDSFAAELSFGLFELSATLQRERAETAAVIARLEKSLQDLQLRWEAALSASQSSETPPVHQNTLPTNIPA